MLSKDLTWQLNGSKENCNSRCFLMPLRIQNRGAIAHHEQSKSEVNSRHITIKDYIKLESLPLDIHA